MSRAKVAETGRILLDNLHIEDEDQKGKRLQKRQISAGAYQTNTPNVYENKFQKVNFLGARKPGVVPNLWSAEEDELLKKAVKKHGERNWRIIADEVPNRNHLQCLQRWKKALKPGLIKGHWSKGEDDLLLQLINTYTEQGSINNVNWTSIAQQIEGRNPKQCRERWFLNLDPSINRGPWTAEEDKKLLELAAQCGGRWSLIAKNMDGRTENSVKTRFHSLQRQEARNRGWTAQEDQALLNATLLFGRDWGKISKQLPGRSRGQLKKRFSALTHHRTDLVRQVEVVEQKIQEGKIQVPNPPPPPVGTIVAPILQQGNFESVVQQTVGHPAVAPPPPPASPTMPPASWGQQQQQPPPPMNYYAPPPQPQGQPMQQLPPPMHSQQQHHHQQQQQPPAKKGLNKRYGSSWMASVVDNLDPVVQPGMLQSYPSDLGLGGGTDPGFMRVSDGSETTKGLYRADTSNLAMLDKLLPLEQTAEPPVDTAEGKKTMRQYSSWGSIGGGGGSGTDITAVFGGGQEAGANGIGAPQIMRTGSGKGLNKKSSSSLNWGGSGTNLKAYQSSEINSFLNML